MCKSWKVGIDRYLDNFGLVPDQKNLAQQTRCNIPKEALWNSHVYLKSGLSIGKFCQSMDVNSNPFVGSSLTLDILKPDLQNDFYYTMVNRLLELYGHFVLHFSVLFSNLFDDSFVNFLSWLLKVPNIQSLKLSGLCKNNKLTNMRTKVTKCFVLLHLPKLTNLSKLDIDFNNMSLDIITALVEKYHTQLKTINLPLDIITNFPILKFGNLSEVVIYNVVSCIRLLRLIKFKFRNNLLFIKKIIIYVDIRLDMNDVFEVLAEFKIPTVELRTAYKYNLGLYTSMNFQNNRTLDFLTSLTISDSVELRYNFLNYTIGLKLLCILPISSSNDEIGSKNSINERVFCYLDAIIWRCLYDKGYPTKKLWETLPKLEIFSVSKHNGVDKYMCKFLRNFNF